MPRAFITWIGDVRAEADSRATNLLRFCAVHLYQGVNSNEDTHHNRARRKPPARLFCTQRRADGRDHFCQGRGWSVIDLSTIAAVIAGATGLGIVVWVLAKLGRALIAMAEALAAAAAVFLALWLVIKSVGWALHQTLTVSVATGLLAGWRLLDLRSFDVWAGRHLRSWWLRWSVYAPQLPQWLQACGLGITHDTAPVVVALTPLGRGPGPHPAPRPGPAAQGAGGALRGVLG